MCLILAQTKKVSDLWILNDGIRGIAQEGEVTSDRVIVPGDTEIEWPVFKQLLVQCKAQELGLDEAFNVVLFSRVFFNVKDYDSNS